MSAGPGFAGDAPGLGTQKLPPARVDLPAVPDLSGPGVAKRHEDGSFSVTGLRSDHARWKGKEVLLRAHVVEIYRCPDPKKKDPPCDASHFWVADRANGTPSRLMVVGYDPEDEETPEPEAGKLISIKGRYDTQNEQGFVASAGLLRLTSWSAIESAPSAIP